MKSINTNEFEGAVMERNSDYDGIFFYGVKSTMKFCRPSCPSKQKNPENLVYFTDSKAASVGGYDSCKICKPDEVEFGRKDFFETVRTILESKTGETEIPSSVRPSLERFFKYFLGFSYSEFVRLCRVGKALEVLREHDMEEVIFSAGYDSLSGYRDAFSRLFNETPKKALEKKSLMFDICSSPLGPIYIGADEERLYHLEFAQRCRLKDLISSFNQSGKRFCRMGSGKITEMTIRQLEEYFQGKRKEFSVPLALEGTDFQIRAWEYLTQIPYGETVCYQDEASALGYVNACQAIGNANGKNRIAIIVPCHRVVNRNGKMGGYGGGLWRKIRLLELERGLAAF